MRGQLLQGEVRKHDAILGQASIHYTLTTQLASELDLRKAVRSLLNSDIAVSAAWPSEQSIRVTPQTRKLALLLKRMEKLNDDAKKAQQGSALKGLAKFALKHPVVMWKGNRRRRAQHTLNESEKASEGGFEETHEFGLNVVLDAQKISAVEREIDARLFGGASRDYDEFVRLNLRGSYHQIQIPGTDETFYVVFEPRLLLHSSGVAQLTIAVPIKTEVSSSQIIELSRSDRAGIANSRIPRPLVGFKNSGVWLDDLDAGAQLLERAKVGECSLDDLLHEHMHVVARAMKLRFRKQWTVYPTVFGAAGKCCPGGAKWRERHTEDLAKIAARHDHDGTIRKDRLIGPDLAVGTDTFLNANLGSTTLIDFTAHPREPFEELNTVLLTEHVMLQYCRLQAIETRVAQPKLYGRKLSRLQREAIGVLVDMRQHELRFGSAREIATHLLKDLGALEMRRTIETALNLAAQGNATFEARMQARRSNTLAMIGTVLAGLVAIPVLAQLIDLALEIDPSSGPTWVLAPFHWLSGLGGWGPWIIVAGLLLMLFTVWLLRKAWWMARVSWIMVRIITGTRGPKVPSQFTLSAELSKDAVEIEENHRSP